MCSGAIIQSRISKVVYGLSEERFGCVENTFEYFKNKQNHNVETEKGVLKEDIENLMKTFFKEMREKKKNGGNNV
jgi:tRNA(adenine34) deaminase